MGALWAKIEALTVSRWTIGPVGAYSQIAIPLKLSLGGKSFKSWEANGILQHLYVSGTVTRHVTGISTSRSYFIWSGDEDKKDARLDYLTMESH